MNAKTLLFFLIIVLPFQIYSQNSLKVRKVFNNRPGNGSKNTVLMFPDGEAMPVKKGLEILKSKGYQSTFQKNKIENASRLRSIDTVKYWGNYNISFGFYGQDVMMQFFQAPADMQIKAVGFAVADSAQYPGKTVSVRLVKLNWTAEDLMNINVPKYMGYYPSEGDGFNNADYFGEEATGNWIDQTGMEYPLPPWTNNPDPKLNTFDYDLWSDGGKGISVQPIPTDSNNQVYQWIETNITGEEPLVTNGEIFAVVVKHDGLILGEDGIEFWAASELGYPGWKYYENGRVSPSEPGWWVRKYTWNFAVIADFFEEPCRIIDFTKLLTRMPDDQPSEVCATLECPQNASEVNLVYMVDSLQWNSIPMDSVDYNRFCASIPPQKPGSKIVYHIEVIEKDGTVLTSRNVEFFIFSSGAHTLLVLNGQNDIDYYLCYESDSYFNCDFPYDIWTNGPLNKELIGGYKNIFEITTNGPEYYHKGLIENWLNEDSTRNYFLAGQEWLRLNNFGETDSFDTNILGIKRIYKDVSIAGGSGQNLPSRLLPVENSPVAGAMYLKFMENGPTDSLIYDPVGELGFIDNRIDAFDPVDSNNVDMFVETRGIENLPDIRNKPCVTHNITDNGNKVVFAALDPIAISSVPQYFNYGKSKVSLVRQAYIWFEGLTDIVGENNELPETFYLSQNYPNPFNPSTTITYIIPTSETLHATSQQLVQLKVYDVLGREIATLVNKRQLPGNYTVTFNAKNLPSGLYFYKLKAGSFSQTKKMLLLK